MRARAILVACTAALAFAAPALAAPPHLAPSDRAAVDKTLDIFVNHAVKRHNPAAVYDVLTPTMKAGMSRQQWSRGDIPVYPYPAAGQKFHGWTIQYRTRDELALELILSPTAKHQGKLGQILFHVYLHPGHGKWLVDSFMPGATFAPIGKPGVVQAARDFQANPSARPTTGPTRSSLRTRRTSAPSLSSSRSRSSSSSCSGSPSAGSPRTSASAVSLPRTRGPWTALRLACRVMELELGRVTDRKPPFKFSSLTRVGFSDTDAQGIVYYGRYFPYFDVARVEYFRHLHLLYADFEGDLVLRALDIEYHAPARFDDLLEVFIRVERIGRTSMTFEAQAYRVDDDLFLAEAHQTVVHVDLEDRKACPIPDPIRAGIRDFEGYDVEL